jgi:hypothetical protein
MADVNIHSLYKLLKQNDFDVQEQKDSNQLYIIFKQDSLEFPLFLKTDGSILQMIIFLPCKLQPNTAPDMGRLLHLLNKEIDLPGFGMDESPGITFYRLIIPTNGKIDPEVFLSVLNAMPRLGQMFFPLIAKVANGTKFETVAGNLTEVMKKFANQ